MSRSSKKKPFIAPELIKRVEAMNESGNKEVIKTLLFMTVENMCQYILQKK